MYVVVNEVCSSRDYDVLLMIFIAGLCPSCQDIKTSVCQCEETVSELHQRAQKVAPLVYDIDHQPRRHVSAATLCSYRPLNVRPTVISMFIFIYRFMLYISFITEKCGSLA